MKFFNKKDLITIIIVIAVCSGLWLIYNQTSKDKPAKAEIYYYEKLVKTVELNKNVDKTFTLPQDEHVVFHLYKDGSIKFEQSDCPDKVCIKTGKVNIVGQMAACLPNGFVLKIVPANKYTKDDLDIVVGGAIK